MHVKMTELSRHGFQHFPQIRSNLDIGSFCLMRFFDRSQSHYVVVPIYGAFTYKRWLKELNDESI